MQRMIPLVILSVGTGLIALLAILAYSRNRSIAFVIGILIIYYFTLYGAWHIVAREVYHWTDFGVLEELERHMFKVQLDDAYQNTLAIYTLFILTLECGILFFWPGRGSEIQRGKTPSFHMLHLRLLIFAATLTGLSIAIMLPHLSEAWQSGVSGYQTTRLAGSAFFTLHQVASELALLLSCIGLSSCLGGPENRYLACRASWLVVAAYASLLLILGLYETILGNRNELLTAGIAGGLFYLQNVRKPNKRVIFSAFILITILVDIVSSTRGIPISDLYRVMTSADSGVDLSALFELSANGSESYAAHLSLYGVLAKQVEPFFGISISPLISSLIPRAIWTERPDDVYAYYASSMGLVDSRGFTIHHATGWYLNFGLCGILFGGLFLSAIWSLCARVSASTATNTTSFGRAFACVALPSFIGHLPSLLRAGFEGYKAIVLESLLLPSLILALAIKVYHPLSQNKEGIRQL